MQVGDLVEVIGPGTRCFGRTGTIVEKKSIYFGSERWVVKLDPVENVQGQIFDLGFLYAFTGQLRQLSPIEYLAKTA